MFTFELSSADPGSSPRGMQDLREKLEKLLTEAEDCDLIARLATDPKKRELFARLATDLRNMARDIETMIASKSRE